MCYIICRASAKYKIQFQLKQNHHKHQINSQFLQNIFENGKCNVQSMVLITYLLFSQFCSLLTMFSLVVFVSSTIGFLVVGSTMLVYWLNGFRCSSELTSVKMAVKLISRNQLCVFIKFLSGQKANKFAKIFGLYGYRPSLLMLMVLISSKTICFYKYEEFFISLKNSQKIVFLRVANQPMCQLEIDQKGLKIELLD